MNVLKRLFDLQAIDLEMKKDLVSLKDIERRLNENVELNKAKEDLKQISEDISKLKSKKKDIEFDIADLTKNSAQISSKLYGGSIKNPKELLGLEQELSDFKKKLSLKEDGLIELMSDEESKNEKFKEINKKVKELDISWEKQKNTLTVEKAAIEKHVDDMGKQRDAVILDMDPESLKIYDRLFSRKGCAIVRIEQGRCQGCRLALPMSDLQRTRGGKLVQCSSCGMILYSGQ